MLQDLEKNHIRAAAAPSRLSKSTIYRLSCQMNIPSYKKGRKLQFLKSEIDAWLKEGKRKTVAEIYAEATRYVNSRPLKKFKR